MRSWWNWYTRKAKDLVGATPSEFKSRRPHHFKGKKINGGNGRTGFEEKPDLCTDSGKAITGIFDLVECPAEQGIFERMADVQGRVP